MVWSGRDASSRDLQPPLEGMRLDAPRSADWQSHQPDLNLTFFACDHDPVDATAKGADANLGRGGRQVAVEAVHELLVLVDQGEALGTGELEVIEAAQLGLEGAAPLVEGLEPLLYEGPRAVAEGIEPSERSSARSTSNSFPCSPRARRSVPPSWSARPGPGSRPCSP